MHSRPHTRVELRTAPVLLPRQPYDVHYTSDEAQIGFAFEAQEGWHALGSDRRTPFRARPNSLAFVPAGCDVASRSETGGEYLTIKVFGGHDCLPDRPVNNLEPAGTLAVAMAFRNRMIMAPPPDALEIEHAVDTLLEAVVCALASCTAETAVGWMTPLRLKRVDDAIEARLHEPLTVAELAGELGLSPGFFGRAFKIAVGRTPHDYIVDRRVSRARGLIALASLPLADIAVASGFSSQAHMTTQFRQRLGVTPGQFRNRC
jgi:AraC family transcriptional regulator